MAHCGITHHVRLAVADVPPPDESTRADLRPMSAFSASRQRLSANGKLSRGLSSDVSRGLMSLAHPRRSMQTNLLTRVMSGDRSSAGRLFVRDGHGINKIRYSNQSQSVSEPLSWLSWGPDHGKGISRPETLGYSRRKCSPKDPRRLRMLGRHTA